MSTKVEGQSVSPNDAKPDVAGSPVSSSQDIALAKCLEALKGLSYKDAQDVLYNALSQAKEVALIIDFMPSGLIRYKSVTNKDFTHD